jgi:hypothetical protein
MYLVHRDHSFVAIKLQQAAQHIADGNRDGAEEIFVMLHHLRPDDASVKVRIDTVRAGLADPARNPVET